MASDLPARNTNSGAEHTTQARQPDPWRIAWHFATSNTLLAAALVILAVLLFATAYLPQVPANTSSGVSDLAVYSRWLALVQNRFGSTSTLLQTLGLFSIFNTVLFRALVGLIGGLLIVRLIDSIEETQASRFPPPPSNDQDAFTSDQALADIIVWLRSRRFRVIETDEYIIADRFPMSTLSRILAIVGALCLMIGLALSSTSGWRSQALLGIGETAPVGHNTPYSLHLNSLHEDTSGQITILQEIDPLASGLVARGRSLDAAGLSIHLQDVGPATRVSATISESHALDLLASASAAPTQELLLLFTPNEPERFFAIPDVEMLVRIGLSQPTQTFRVWLYQTRTGGILFEGNLPTEGTIHTENVTLKIQTEKYANLIAAHNPGKWLTATGWLLGVLGLLGSCVWPLQRLWLRAAENGQTEITSDGQRSSPPDSIPLEESEEDKDE